MPFLVSIYLKVAASARRKEKVKGVQVGKTKKKKKKIKLFVPADNAIASYKILYILPWKV